MSSDPLPPTRPHQLATERFFAIPELIYLTLTLSDTISLVHCQRVCRTWADIIADSPALQQALFFKAVAADENHTAQAKPVLVNPVVESYFTPLLAFSKLDLPNDAFALQSRVNGTTALELLPWARDGIIMDAPARVAFTRAEASWRRMYLTQPPTHQLDWWHDWDASGCMQRNPEEPVMAGEGQGRTYSTDVALGMLWDIVEARLIRGCTCQVTIFPSGCPLEDDPTAGSMEKGWARRLPGSRCGFVATSPRIRLDTHQVWTQEPSMYQSFDVQSGSWIVADDLPETLFTDDERLKYQGWDGNGLIWLNEDCRRDDEESNRRWSKSEGASDSSLLLRSEGHGRQGHVARVRRMATQARVHAMLGRG